MPIYSLHKKSHLDSHTHQYSKQKSIKDRLFFFVNYKTKDFLDMHLISDISKRGVSTLVMEGYSCRSSLGLKKMHVPLAANTVKYNKI